MIMMFFAWANAILRFSIGFATLLILFGILVGYTSPYEVGSFFGNLAGATVSSYQQQVNKD